MRCGKISDNRPGDQPGLFGVIEMADMGVLLRRQHATQQLWKLERIVRANANQSIVIELLEFLRDCQLDGEEIHWIAHRALDVAQKEIPR